MPKLCPQFKQTLQAIQEKIVFFDAEMEKLPKTKNTAPVLELRKEIQEKLDQLKEKMTPLLIQVKLKKLEKIIGHEIPIMEVTIGGKTKEQLIQELEAKDIYVSDYAKDMMAKMEIAENPKQLTLVRLTVKDLGFPEGATTAEIMGTENDLDDQGNPAPFTKGKMTELGLELCPAETGPNLRLQNSTPDWMLIGMKQIAVRGGSPRVFRLVRLGDRLMLGDDWTDPAYGWDGINKFVFRLRPSTKAKLGAGQASILET